MAIVSKATLKTYFQTGDFPTEAEFINLFDTLYPYEKYNFFATQIATNAPTVVVRENTIGGTPIWSRTNPGEYLATLAGGFPGGASKVAIISGVVNGQGQSYLGEWIDANSIAIYTSDSTFATVDNLLTNTFFEVRIYP